MGLAHDGDTALLHGFEKSGLSLGGSAVDFVGEDEVGEEGAGLEDEAATGVGLLEHGIACDVAGEEIGSELDAFGIEPEGLRQAFDEFGFAEAWEAFEENVAAGEEAGEDVFDESVLAEQDAAKGLAEEVDLGGCLGGFGVGEGMVHGGNFER
jgi:hypothetical protein